MEEKDVKLLTNYLQIFRELEAQHANVDEFNKFKSWAELEVNVHAIFEVFEEFYQQLNTELTNQGIKDAVLAEDFDPKTLTNPEPIINIVKNTMTTKVAEGKFLGSLAGNWAKQRLAYNNITLHYEVFRLAEQLQDKPDDQSVLIAFIEQYNENMGNLNDLLNKRFDKVDRKYVKLSEKITKVIKRISSMADKVKDVPDLVAMVKLLTGKIETVAQNTEKIQDVLDALDGVEKKLGILKDEIVDGVDSKLETRLNDFKDELIEEIKKLLDERERKKNMRYGSRFGSFVNAHLPKVVAGVVTIGLGLGMGHFIAANNNRNADIADMHDDAVAIYEMYNGEGSAEGKSWDEIMSALGELGLEQHDQSQIDKMNGYDKVVEDYNQAVEDYEQAMGDYNAAIEKYNGLWGSLTAEFEKINGEGSAEGKNLTELLEGLVKTSGGDVTIVNKYEAEIVDLYDKLFPEGEAMTLEEMLGELNDVSIKSAEDEKKIAEYDEAMSAVSSTYTSLTGNTAEGLTVAAMLDEISDMINNSSDTLYGRTIMLQLYSNVMHASGESLSDEELYKFVCELYDLEATYIENDHSDTFEPSAE